MEAIIGDSSENYASPETVTTVLGNNHNIRTLTFILPADYTEDVNGNSTSCLSSSYNSSPADLIAFSQDLLTEIFLRLPVISLIRFMSASKQWNSLIKSSSFCLLRNDRNPYIDLPSGLFFEGWDSPYKNNYVPLDSRNIPVNKPPFITLGFDSGRIKILQFCNGLLLCDNDFRKHYVFNPTTKRFTTIPQHNNYNPDTSCHMTLAFDPSRSSQYKVVCNYMHKSMTIEIYSSESRTWKISNECMDDLVDIDCGAYGHNAIHWMSFPNRLVYLKLDDESVIRFIDIETPDTSSIYGILDEFLAESCDGMLLLVRCCEFRRLNVYEIKKDYSEWKVKYHVDLEMVIRVYPNVVTRLGIHFIAQSFVVAEREDEDDSFVVLELPGKLIQYKFLVKKFCELCDFSKKSTHNQDGFFPKTIFHLSDFTPENRRFINGNCFHFIPSLADV